MSFTDIEVQITINGLETNFYASVEDDRFSSPRELCNELKDLFRRFIQKRPLPQRANDSPPASPKKQKTTNRSSVNVDARPRSWTKNITDVVIRKKGKGAAVYTSMLHKIVHQNKKLGMKVAPDVFHTWWKKHKFRWKCANPKDNRYNYGVRGCRVLRTRGDLWSLFESPTDLAAYLNNTVPENSPPASPLSKAPASPAAKATKQSPLDELLALTSTPQVLKKRLKELEMVHKDCGWTIAGAPPMTTEQAFSVLTQCPPMAVFEPPKQLYGYGVKTADKLGAWQKLKLFRLDNKIYTPKRFQIRDLGQALKCLHVRFIRVKGDPLDVEDLVLSPGAPSLRGVKKLHQWVTDHCSKHVNVFANESKETSNGKSEASNDASEASKDESEASNDESDASQDASDASKDEPDASKDEPEASDDEVDDDEVDDDEEERVDSVLVIASPNEKRKRKRDGDNEDKSQNKKKKQDAAEGLTCKWVLTDANEQLHYEFTFNGEVKFHFNAMDTIQPCPDADDNHRSSAIRTFLGIIKKHVPSRLFMEAHPAIRQSWEYLEEDDRLETYLARDPDFMATYTKVCEQFTEKETPTKNHTTLSELVNPVKSPQSATNRRATPKRKTIHTRKNGVLHRYPRRKR